MSWQQFFLDLARILAWPMVATFALVLILVLFKEEVSKYIGGIYEIVFPGGWKIKTHPPEKIEHLDRIPPPDDVDKRS